MNRRLALLANGVMTRRVTRPIARLAIGALLALLANGLLSQTAAAVSAAPRLAASALPPGAILFSHRESGWTAQYPFSNLFAIDAQNPTVPSRLTNFSYPTSVEWPVWSKDFSRLAFVSNVNNGFKSLEAKSIYTAGPDARNLRQVTGFGLINPLPQGTGVVRGHVLPPATGGQISSCFVSVQGDSRNPPDFACAPDGSFTITNVPDGSRWVQAQASVTDGFGGPGFSMGWASIQVIPGQTIDAPPITLSQNIPESDEPAWSPDGTSLITDMVVKGKSLQPDPVYHQTLWTPYRTNQLVLQSADGTASQAIANPPGIQYLGPDWSPPPANRICFAANGTGAGDSSLYLADPSGANPSLLYRVPSAALGVLWLVSSCRWSPDGQRIAFIVLGSNLYGAWSDLYVINSNADPASFHRLTQNPYGSFTDVPAWSPDGHALVYEVDTNQGVDLFAVDPSTLGVVQLTNDHRSSSPAWGRGQPFTRTVGPALAQGSTGVRPAPPPPVPPAPPGPRLFVPAAGPFTSPPGEGRVGASDPLPPALGEGRVGVIVLQCLRALSSLLGGP